jgi:hypothetical protein
MSIVEDYAGIAAELRRIRAEKLPEKFTVAPREPAAQHRMRATITGELLYRRLIAKKAPTRRDGLDPQCRVRRGPRRIPTKAFDMILTPVEDAARHASDEP